MKSFRFMKPDGNLSVEYPSEIVPAWFAEVFRATALAYYASAKKQPVWQGNVSPNMAALLSDYFRHNGLRADTLGFPQPERQSEIRYPLHRERVTVMFTGGKDSMHLVLRLIESGVRPQDMQALYVKNLNRSETYYEQRAIPKICDKLGIRHRIITISNSIKINRTGHNIGLREELILGLGVPYILDFQSSRIIYGLHEGFHALSPALYCSHKTAFAHYLRYLGEFGVHLTVENHIDYPNVNEMTITRDLIERYREYLDLGSSCYTQKNFREAHHDRQQAKYPHIRLYHGCGYCLKCLRVNGAILLYDKDVQRAPEAERKGLEAHIRQSFQEKFPTDHTLQLIMDQCREMNKL